MVLLLTVTDSSASQFVYSHKYLGLIHWGIIIHGFIDGYSCFIAALQASNNNTGQTVLEVFEQAVALCGVPNRLHGNHGVENILAAWLEQFCGTGHMGKLSCCFQVCYIYVFTNPIIQSVHNIQIKIAENF